MKREILQSISFGHQIAEDESEALNSYFVETDQWHRIYSGNVDVIYGSKGAGKSAIYSLLINRRNALFDRNILIVSAENPRGAPAFKDIIADPPTSEREFQGIWKIYLLSLIGKQFEEYSFSSNQANKVLTELRQAGFLKPGISLSALLRTAVDYVRSITKIESIESEIKIDPITGSPTGISGKITLRQPSTRLRDLGFISVDDLFILADEALKESNYKIWILIDRLDVAFSENPELEKNALSALFRVYLDLVAHKQISIKIFLRSDIWKRIVHSGFREASHITRHVYIKWDDQSLMNLIMCRIIIFESIAKYYGIDRGKVISNASDQEEVFYKIFPKQIEPGSRQAPTFGWMLAHTADGTKENAPRELIHLLNASREIQLRKLEIGASDPPGENLFLSTSIKEALSEVSKVRLEQTLISEYPQHRVWLEKLERQKTQQTPTTLAGIWGTSEEKAQEIATQLTEIGFFELRGSREFPVYWVPFLYRDSLQMVQGSA